MLYIFETNSYRVVHARDTTLHVRQNESGEFYIITEKRLKH